MATSYSDEECVVWRRGELVSTITKLCGYKFDDYYSPDRRARQIAKRRWVSKRNSYGDSCTGYRYGPTVPPRKVSVPS